MNNSLNVWWLHVLFALVGALVGIGFYLIFAILIRSRISPSEIISSAVYTSIAGLLISGFATSANDKG